MAKLSVVSCIWSTHKLGGAVPSRSSRYEVMFFNDMHMMQVATEKNEWTILTQSGEIPSPRDSHTLSHVAGRLYLFGGKNTIAGEGSLPGAHSFSVENNEWKTLKSPGAPPAATGHSSNVVGKSIFVFGGLVHGEATNSLHEFNTEDSTWAIPESEGNPPKPRCDHASEAVNGVLYIFGGCASAEEWLDDLICFNTLTKTWYTSDIRGLPPRPRCAHTCVAHRDKDIYIFGGLGKEKGKNKIIGDMRKLSIGNKKWKSIYSAGDEPPKPRYGHCAVICHSRMYIIGGMESTGEAQMDKLHILRLINPSERNLVLSHALKDLEGQNQR